MIAIDTRNVYYLAMTDTELITFYGGPAKFARLLALDGAKGVRRVCNWRKRGIPARIKLAFPKIFKRQLTSGAFSQT